MTASGLTIAAIMGAMLLVFIFSGYYLFAALGGAAIISGLIFWGPNVFQTIYFSVFKYCKDYNLSLIHILSAMTAPKSVRSVVVKSSNYNTAAQRHGTRFWAGRLTPTTYNTAAQGSNRLSSRRRRSSSLRRTMCRDMTMLNQ